jgi:subtilisin-like proprotein convertase family protein
LYARAGISILVVLFAFTARPLMAETFTAPPDQVNLRIPPSGTGASNGPATISSLAIPISSYETIQSVRVHVDIAHTYDGDLIISLIAPNGDEIVLASRRGGSGDNYTGTVFDRLAGQSITTASAPFTGSFAPESAPDHDMARPPYGVWKLKIQDVAAGDTGTLLGWSVELETYTNQTPTRWNPQWTTPTAVGVTAYAASDAFLGFGNPGLCFLGSGYVLNAFRRETNSVVNLPIWSLNLGATISAITPWLEFFNDLSVFTVSQDGFLRKIRQGGTTAWSRDLRRPGCPLGDGLQVAPLVQGYNTASAAFQSNVAARGFLGQDVVFVATSYGCGNTTGNKVYALPVEFGASDACWIFNDLGTETVNKSHGMALDSSSDTLFLATEGALHVQPSLFAISTLDGSVKWEQDAGPIYCSPLLIGNSLYVLTHDGQLVLYDATGGQEMWRLTVTTNTTCSKEMTFAPDYYTILITDDGGAVHGFVDLGGYAEVAWPDPVYNSAIIAPPGYVVGTGKFYVAEQRGAIARCDINTGTPELEYFVANADSITGVLPDSNTGVVTNRLLITGSKGGFNFLSRLYIPFDFDPPDSSSGSASSDLAIQEADNPNVALPGQFFSYTFNVFNNALDYELFYGTGGDEVRPVFVTNTIPAGLSFNSAVLSQGTYTVSDHQLVVNLDAMTNGAMATITVQATATNTGTFANIARVATSDPSFFESQPTNDVSITALTIVTPELHIRLVNNLAELFWSTNLIGFNLEGTPDLSPPVWGPVTPLPVIVGDQNVVTNSLIPAHRFYRLSKP